MNSPLEQLNESFPVFDIGRVSNGRYYCLIPLEGTKIWRGGATMDDAIKNAIVAANSIIDYAYVITYLPEPNK